LILAFEAVVFSASVGDSRAVLGTQKLPNIFPVPQASTSDRQVLEEIRNRRSSNPDIEIFPLQLTKDQKPNDEEEKKYILSCGGRVQRIVDEFGKMIGPFRVWDKSGNFPGLAMSRSIGDLIAKRLGVISTPIITKYQIKPNDDFFLIIASDGVWDAMENEDAVNFVECFRRKCKNEKVEDEDIVTPHNSCIAQLLAEEARIRWYSIVAEEDVKIDDISVIIVEMNFSEKPVNTGIKKTMNRRTVIQKDTIEGIDYFRAPSIKEVVIGDPKRSSVVGEGPED
jgi:serine/threonine protein phosphatase PrpC